MIGFSSLSNAAGMACLTLAAESQLNNPSTERQSASNRSEAQLETSDRAKRSGASQASEMCMTRATTDHLSIGQLEQAKQGFMKVIARRLHELAAEVYRYVLGMGNR